MTLPFRLQQPPPDSIALPLFLYSVGSHYQYRHIKPQGFPVYQFFLVQSGSGLFRDLDSGVEWRLDPGQAFLFPSDRAHEYFPISSEPWHIGFIGFFGNIIDSFLEGIGLQSGFPFYPKYFEECWNGIRKLWGFIDSSSCLAAPVEAHLQDVSVSLYRLLLTLRTTELSKEAIHPAAVKMPQNELIHKAIRLMNQHYTQHLPISELAKAVGYSVQHFQFLFQQEFGVTPHKYLQNLRLERAMQMIRENPALPVQEVAQNLGMEPSYLIRLFRHKYGHTPGDAKKRTLMSMGII